MSPSQSVFLSFLSIVSFHTFLIKSFFVFSFCLFINHLVLFKRSFNAFLHFNLSLSRSFSFFWSFLCLLFLSIQLSLFLLFTSSFLCQSVPISLFVSKTRSVFFHNLLSLSLSISVRPSVKTIFVLSLFVIPFFPVTQVCRTACRGRTLKTLTPTTLGQANGNLTMRMPQRWTEFDETCKTFAFACNPFLLILHWTCKNWNLFYFNLYWNLLFSKTATINEIIEN